MKRMLSALCAIAMLLSTGLAAFASEDYAEGNELNGERRLPVGDKANKLHDGDVVYPGKTVYLRLLAAGSALMNGLTGDDDDYPIFDRKEYRAFGELMTDKKLVSCKVHLDEGAKLIESITITQKKENQINDGKGKVRYPYFKMVLNDFYTDDEQRVEGYIEIKFKKDVVFKNGRYIELPEGETLSDYEAGRSDGGIWGSGYPYPKGYKVRVPFKFFLNNRTEETGDKTVAAGEGGCVVKPTKNDAQEFLWEDANNTLATLRYDSDDAQTKAYSKLSTRWSGLGETFYEEHFAGRDAFLYDFVAGPSASAASRATLELRFPFVDEDGEATAGDGEWAVFEYADGELADATSRFALVENEEGELVLQTRLRTLGAYIVAGPEGAGGSDPAAPVPTGIVLSAYAK